MEIKGKGRKSTKKKDDEEETVWDSEGQKERVLSAVLHSLELDLSRLWKLDVPEEEFLNLYSKVYPSLNQQLRELPYSKIESM